ncbi:tetratricopeptide repeat protein [Leptothermofonsia sp. ETS-13]|uniref:tetratricopeptide repeat protein n=1 Tax=Leptothermofonsia sp. ETS-13 TaxID=3035696 RepID=UPI003B9DCEFC
MSGLYESHNSSTYRESVSQTCRSPQGSGRSRLQVFISPASFFLLFNLAIGLLMGGVWVNAPASAQTTSPAVNEGYVLLNRGWVNDAIAAFQRALRSNPNSLEARLGLAIAYQRAGQDSNAWQTYQQVLQQDPNQPTALKAIGLLGGYRPEWQAQGIEALTKLLQATPNDNEVRAQRALLYGYQGRFSEALADYQLLLQTNPKPDVILGAAQIYTYSGDYSQGLALFQRYQNLGKTIPDSAITAYAQALRQTGKTAEAVQILETRLNQRKSFDALTIELRTALAAAYQANNQPEQVAAVLAPLRNRPEAALPLARSLSAIARSTGNREMYQEAIALYRQVLAKTPEPSPGLVVEVADVMSEASLFQAEALQLYQQAIQQQPTNSPLKIKQLILAQQVGHISRSELTQQLLVILQPLPSVQAERRLLAQALLKLDSPDPQLLSVYQELVQSGVDVPFLNFRMAQMQMQMGELDAAKQTLAAYRATAIGSQDLATELLLAEIERRENQLDKAAQRYESVISANPSNTLLIGAMRGLAGVRQAQGRMEDALQIYDQILNRNPTATWAQLGRTAIAYEAKRLSVTEAEAVLNQWLANSAGETPPELFSLVGALPPAPEQEALYSRLLKMNPDHLAVQRRFIQVLAMRDPEQARSQINQLLQRNPNNLTAYFVKGELAQTLGHFDEAADAYQTILQRQPDNLDALLALGGVRFQQQRYREAETIYIRIATLRPNDWDIRRILAELSLAQDHPQIAIQQLKQAEQIQKTQGTSDSILSDRLERVQVDHLRRRGFQPSWERY